MSNLCYFLRQSPLRAFLNCFGITGNDNFSVGEKKKYEELNIHQTISSSDADITPINIDEDRSGIVRGSGGQTHGVAAAAVPRSGPKRGSGGQTHGVAAAAVPKSGPTRGSGGQNNAVPSS
ncbi:hypothetical protein PanWU01x14_255610 [Parasponia andersonii]|uniref:Uncharacterized protein n=1 Tax=Parasponia andersonii TaxID=3476 RepID=A0A2P5BAS6_PARAD|nr:hypothetical protein PanWU01x14_255610 [Parasponia andersonii]